MKNLLVSAIVVNWDGKHYLVDCLGSLANLKTKHLLEIIVVDNGSKDGSVAYLTSQIPKFKKRKINLKIIENKKNLGFALANNQGFEKARGDLILFLNNDTKVSRDFLHPLVEALVKSSKIGAVQPKILYYDKLKFDSTGSFFTNTGVLFHRGHQQKDKGQFEKKGRIFSMKGACMLFKKNVLDKVGLFDEDFFAYFEETDLCHRVWLSGYEILYVPQSEIYHKVGGSTSKVGAPFIQYHSFKNKISTYQTNFEIKTLLCLIPIHLILCFAAAMAFFMITLGGIWYATSDAISGKSQGKEWVTNAIWGLLLVIGAYVILNTINPKILTFSLEIPRPEIATSTAGIAAGCSNCVTLSSLGIPTSGSAVGKSISPSFGTKLSSLSTRLRSAGAAGSSLAWSVTEAYPPSIVHNSPCHNNGTCVDANISGAGPANINAFFSAAASAGINASYEVKTLAELETLKAGGVRVSPFGCSGNGYACVNSQATGSHFHIK